MKIKLKRTSDEKKSEMREILEREFCAPEKPLMREDKVRVFNERQAYLRSFAGTQAEGLANLVLQNGG